MLPISVSGINLSTSGGWAALEDSVGPPDVYNILLVHLDDGVVYRVRPRSGYGTGLLGLSEATLLAWEAPTALTPGARFDALIRYDIGTLIASMTPESTGAAR
jgi:hypothetical protein